MIQLLMRRPDLNGLPTPPALAAGMTLREAQPEDVPSLAALLGAAFEDPDWTADRVRAELLEAPDVKTTHVVVTGGTVIATASARLLPDKYPGAGYVHWVASLPGFRGMHLGYIVSLTVLHEFVTLGCRDAVLKTEAFRLPAIRLYRSLGFQPVHRDAPDRQAWAQVEEQLAAL